MNAPITTPTPKLTTIHLVGSLGRAIGHTKLELDVFSAAEAVRAIDIVTNGKLGTYLSGPARDKLYKVAVQRKENTIGREELHNRSGRSTIFIMPTIRGRDSGVGKVLAGVALIALAVIGGPAGWAIAGQGAGWFGAGIATIGVGFGVSLLVGGITQLLTPSPKTTDNAELAQSTSFQGNASAVAQGGPIPVVYGRALVPAVPISVTVLSNNVSSTSAGTLGAIGITRLKGGGVQYESEP